MIWDLRRLMLGILLLAAAAGSWWFLRAMTEPEPKARSPISAATDPDYFVENFRATVMNTNGRRRYTLAARLLEHYPHSHTVQLTDPHLVQFETGRPAIDAKADFGSYNRTSKEVTMSGNVLIVQNKSATSRGSETRTERLHILLK
ncbi:MAG: LPS export ABC transporter periplasmic protein LptC [Acidiferrobacterales bacterium]